MIILLKSETTEFIFIMHYLILKKETSGFVFLIHYAGLPAPPLFPLSPLFSASSFISFIFPLFLEFCPKTPLFSGFYMISIFSFQIFDENGRL